MEHKMEITYECAKELLEKAGVYKFATEISKLSEICFSGEPKDEFSDTILSYIFSGGVYGTSQNKIAVKKSNQKAPCCMLFKDYSCRIKAWSLSTRYYINCPFSCHSAGSHDYVKCCLAVKPSTRSEN